MRETGLGGIVYQQPPVAGARSCLHGNGAGGSFRPLPGEGALPRQAAMPQAGDEKVWSWKGQHAPWDGEQGTPSQVLRDDVSLSDPAEWRDIRRSKTAKDADSCYGKSISMLELQQRSKWKWGAELTTKPSSSWLEGLVSAQGQAGAAAAHEAHVGVKYWCITFCKEGRIADAVDVLDLGVQQRCYVHNNLFYRVLKGCVALKDLALVRRIHALTIRAGYEGDPFLATHLVGLYASHGKLEEALGVFYKVSTPDVYLWATIIFACARHGEASQALGLYKKMRVSAAVKPDNRIYVAVLRACATARDVVAGREVHAHIVASEEEPDMFVQTGLLVMYAKCGCLEDARQVFDRLPKNGKNVVSWTAMISGYTQQGMGEEALSLYDGMQREGMSPPDAVTFTCLLQACASGGVGALHAGKQLHRQICERGLQHDVVIGGGLVNMYAKCGCLEDARSTFDRLSNRNVVTWNAMIAGYVQQGMGEEALDLHKRMLQLDGACPPNLVTYTSLLQACAAVGVAALEEGKRMHTQIETQGLADDGPLGCSLVNMYAKCGSLEDARRQFERLPHKNILTWTVMIASYVQQGMSKEALRLYDCLVGDGLGCPPDADTVTFVCLLQACAGVGVAALKDGKRIHAQIAGCKRLEGDVAVGGSLVNMYIKCGSIEDARVVFDRLPVKNTVAWTTMIAGYVQRGMGEAALLVYRGMQQQGMSPPDSVTFTCLLDACASVGAGAFHEGQQLHAQIAERGLEGDGAVGGSLVSMYVKCSRSSLDKARRVFDTLEEKSVVAWNAMIAGYGEQGMCEEALGVYHSMMAAWQEGGGRVVGAPNSVTFVCVLQACSTVCGLSVGQQVHWEIVKQGLQADPVVGAALVNMYARCGSVVDSQQVFDSLPEKAVEAWGALMGGYSRQGNSQAVFALLDSMRKEGVTPSGLTWLAVLTVCSHATGLVDKGRHYFEVMKSGEYGCGVTPSVEHYTCMVDVLGRAGQLEEAVQLARSMPMAPTSAVWHALLGACEKWNNVEIGRQAFEWAVSLDEQDAAAYVLMSNIYARAGMWEEDVQVRARRVRCGAWKQQAGQCWWTDADGVVHTFVVGRQDAR